MLATVRNGSSPLYEKRVQLVTTAVKRHSDLDDERARELAVDVLRALDHVPEKIR